MMSPAPAKKRVKVNLPSGRKRMIREDCAANDCLEVDCDVCHVHDQPADWETGLCDECVAPGLP